MELKITEAELLIIVAARELARAIEGDDPTVFTGFGLPQVVASLVFHGYGGWINVDFEFGVLGTLPEYPLAKGQMGGPRGSYKAEMWTDMETIFNLASCGYINIGMLGAAQIDRFGNANTTMIGDDYLHPKVRMPGSGGANEVAAFCRKTIFVCRHDERKFVEKLDFRTTPGFLDGSYKAREKAGLPPDTGPYRVITTKAVFDFCSMSRQMRLIAVPSWFDEEQIEREVIGVMGFGPIYDKDKVERILPPSRAELKLLREKINPDKSIIGQV